MNFKLRLKKIGIFSGCVLIIVLIMGVILLSNQKINHESDHAEYVDLANLSEDIFMSEVMTYDEMVNELSINENISLDEVKGLVDMETMKEAEDGVRVSPTYRVLSTSVTVTSLYKPTINWYCETSEDDDFQGVLRILNVSLDRDYNGITKQFGGQLFYNLEKADCIFYELNGDFYDNGITTVSATEGVEDERMGSIDFSISEPSNHYTYCFKTGYFK